MNFRQLIVGGGLAAILWVGCQPNVVHQLPLPADDDDTTVGCDDPKPVEQDSFCPPQWECIDGEWQSLDVFCPDPCPVDKPYDGDSCEAVGASCSYYVEESECGDEEFGYDVLMLCTESGWITTSEYCQPEPVCPEGLPLHGSDCTGWDEAYYCDYETSCGYASAWCEYTPEGAQIWQVSSEETAESCECPQAGGANECVLYEHCRWLAPGCTDDMMSAPEGCYPAEACTADGCGLGEVCATVGYDPCFGSECNACSAETQVCLEDG